MNAVFEKYLTERKVWQESFDHLLQFGSEGVLKSEILQAKQIFFAKLGRAHEMKEDLYDAASQSFLEWYLFEYHTKPFTKTPAVTYLTLGMGQPEGLKTLDRTLFDHWSIYEVLDIRRDHIIFDDLLFRKKRKVVFDAEAPECRLWKMKVGQIVQTRLFPLKEEGYHFFTHMWLHPKPEDQLLKKLCLLRSEDWSEHKELLLNCFEAVVRTHGLQSQFNASRSHNWLYQELWKRYAQKNGS